MRYGMGGVSLRPMWPSSMGLIGSTSASWAALIKVRRWRGSDGWSRSSRCAPPPRPAGARVGAGRTCEARDSAVHVRQAREEAGESDQRKHRPHIDPGYRRSADRRHAGALPCAWATTPAARRCSCISTAPKWATSRVRPATASSIRAVTSVSAVSASILPVTATIVTWSCS